MCNIVQVLQEIDSMCYAMSTAHQDTGQFSMLKNKLTMHEGNSLVGTGKNDSTICCNIPLWIVPSPCSWWAGAHIVAITWDRTTEAIHQIEHIIIRIVNSLTQIPLDHGFNFRSHAFHVENFYTFRKIVYCLNYCQLHREISNTCKHYFCTCAC